MKKLITVEVLDEYIWGCVEARRQLLCDRSEDEKDPEELSLCNLAIAHLNSGSMPDSWECDSVQFPRVIAEALAAGVWDHKSDAFRLMCDSMDLEEGEVFNILDRAQKRWDYIVSNTVS